MLVLPRRKSIVMPPRRAPDREAGAPGPAPGLLVVVCAGVAEAVVLVLRPPVPEAVSAVLTFAGVPVGLPLATPSEPEPDSPSSGQCICAAAGRARTRPTAMQTKGTMYLLILDSLSEWA